MSRLRGRCDSSSNTKQSKDAHEWIWMSAVWSRSVSVRVCGEKGSEKERVMRGERARGREKPSRSLPGSGVAPVISLSLSFPPSRQPPSPVTHAHSKARPRTAGLPGASPSLPASSPSSDPLPPPSLLLVPASSLPPAFSGSPPAPSVPGCVVHPGAGARGAPLGPASSPPPPATAAAAALASAADGPTSPSPPPGVTTRARLRSRGGRWGRDS